LNNKAGFLNFTSSYCALYIDAQSYITDGGDDGNNNNNTKIANKPNSYRNQKTNIISGCSFIDLKNTGNSFLFWVNIDVVDSFFKNCSSVLDTDHSGILYLSPSSYYSESDSYYYNSNFTNNIFVNISSVISVFHTNNYSSVSFNNNTFFFADVLYGGGVFFFFF
jgi:hypothetical protein